MHLTAEIGVLLNIDFAPLLIFLQVLLWDIDFENAALKLGLQVTER